MRAASLERFDGLADRFLADIEPLKEAGALVVGIYCTYAPRELVSAAGALPVGLCGKKQAPIPAAEKTLPANLCPLIKSSYGYAITGTCPYFAAADLLVGETTCDGKKKMYEFLGAVKPMHIMHLPFATGAAQEAYWTQEMRRFKEFLESATGNRITEDGLREEIRVQNEVRRLLARVLKLSSGACSPLSGLDMMAVSEAKSYVADPRAYAAMLRDLAAELEAMARAGQSGVATGARRILLTGCPVGRGSEKVVRLLEESGAVVVAAENCSGVKSFDLLADESGDPLVALARRTLCIPCSVMTPNAGRLSLLDRLTEEYRPEGVVDLTWQCCHTYNVESPMVQGHMLGKHGLRTLHIETDYSEADTEQLRTRIEAFLELL
ncbi:(R)-phenyllactyl-CoA dehydratase beta subunit [Fundidesulfovibrio magnetotacticus]|uniref:(R)-phenyllactyl-CoA dehydratase beta subunit n=1 Tax=Fundidesulfovibrio magnetotacticus TaxID=2730080 RepID=A0A6V8LI01_9BACT|nr:double-cubane-cluster-containing anaerobic reductase [Fundidesulfovibrio magnetotacticus]GFK92362.1 (R)-phenyllactyl-CoA dehydratase beta subunit [Fundidesulfovibrio magnetotacticus]